MKSPVSNVGIIEEEGIRNGSNTKVLTTNTKNITGKKEPIESIICNPELKGLFFFLATIAHTQRSPVIKLAKVKKASKSKCISFI
jgi:hypothetical protein